MNEKTKQKKAVALIYRPGKDDAPKVTASGRGKVAERIIETAREYGIPVKDDPDLVEVLSKLDIEEGADMIMVKPGVAYLDILTKIKQRFGWVTAVYQVSGEYAMIEAAAKINLIDRKAIILETLLSFKRAGADFILTYHASEVAEWLKKDG